MNKNKKRGSSSSREGGGEGIALFPDSDHSDEEENGFKNKFNVAPISNGGRSSFLIDIKEEKEEESGWGVEEGFQINKDYAQRYDKWRNKEELMKMKARYGTDNIDELGSDDDESGTSEEEWDEEKEKAFFKTLSNLKKKDPKIYDPAVHFFNQEEVNGEKELNSGSLLVDKKDKKMKLDKPFLLKDHERTMILEKGGLISDSEGEEEAVGGGKSTLSYYQELDSIKKGFSKALQGIESEDEEDEGLLLKGKPKTKEEKEKEEEDYRLWLKGKLKKPDKGNLSKEEVKELTFLRSYWNDEQLDEGEKFLRDYILNRKYIDGGKEKDGDVTTNYNEVAHDSDEGGLSNDEQFEEQREEFEYKYNFRFEEPDPEFIKRFPRTIDDSLRRGDERRKKQRDSAKDRKKEATDRKREEVQRLKAYKRKEILDKLQQLQDISGNPDLSLDDLDIDGDFDPEVYNRKMQKVFNDQYYTDADDDKPQFPYDPEIDDEANWEEWVPTEDDEVEATEDLEQVFRKKVKKSKKTTAAEQEEKQTCAVGPDSVTKTKPSSSTSSIQEELIEISKGRKGKANKKPNIFLEVLERNKPKFNPDVHKSFDKYFKEYYALDFEDLIGDLPCRFKYRKVAPNDFGLSTKEIFNAEDRELNQWASLKKTYQYRADEEEKYEAQAYKKKAENETLKKRVLLSVYHHPISAEGDEKNYQRGQQVVEEVPPNDETEFAPNIHKVAAAISPDQQSTPKLSKRQRKNETEFTPNIHDKVTATISPDQQNTPKLSKRQRKNETEFTPNIHDSIEATISSDQQSTPKLSKRQRKNRRKQNQPDPNNPHVTNTHTSSTLSPTLNPKQNNDLSKKKRHLKNQVPNGSKSGPGSGKRKAEATVDDERLKAYGINPTKHKKWIKYGGGG